MPPFGGHLGTGGEFNSVFGGNHIPSDTSRVSVSELTSGLGNSRYHFAVEANTASSLASSAVAYEGRPGGPPSDQEEDGGQQGKLLNHNGYTYTR